MSGRTEAEVFSFLTENFRLAAERCEKLAWDPYRGFVYNSFVKELKGIEGACIQACDHRADSRWLRIGMLMAEAHRRAGHWMRNSRTKAERKIADARFKMLAENLRMFAREAEDLRDKATGRVGMILPEPLPGPHRDTRPIQVITPGGIVIPAGASVH